MVLTSSSERVNQGVTVDGACERQDRQKSGPLSAGPPGLLLGCAALVQRRHIALIKVRIAQGDGSETAPAQILLG